MTKLILSVLIACLLCASSAAQGAPDPAPRHPRWELHAETVSPGGISRWATHRRFGIHAVVETGVYVDGHELKEQVRCTAVATGRGVLVLLNLCGSRPVPLRMRAISLDHRKHRVTVIWRVVGSE